LLSLEGLLNIAVFAVALNHDAVSDEIWLARRWRIWLEHLLEDLRCLGHIEATNAAIKQRVEGHDVGSHVLVALHLDQHPLVKV